MIDKITWWLQTTLPQVYTEDMSYYELLTAVMNKLNEVTDATNEFLGQDLEKTVTDILNDWNTSGKLADVINNGVFTVINDKITQTKSDLEKEIQTMSQISFKGVKTDLAALQAAYPSGDTGIYVLMSDGHMYAWLNAAWTDCGAVFTVPFADNSITSHMRTKNGNFLLVESSAYLNINTANKTLEFPTSAYTLRVNLMSQSPDIGATYSGQSLDLSFGGDTGGWIYFNTDTLTFKVIYTGSGEVVGENDVFFGVIYWSTNTFYLNANYTVDGKMNFPKRSIPYNQTSYLANSGARLLSTKKVQIDPVTKHVLFPTNCTITMIVGNETKSLTNTLAGTTWDLSANNANYIVYDQADFTLKSLLSMSNVVESQVVLGYINWGTNFAVDLNWNYEVLTGAVGEGTITFQYTKWKDKVLNAIGDSTTFGDDGSGGSNAISWVANMQQLNQFGTVINSGVNGSTVAIQSGRSDSFVERWNSLASADLFTILGGANDFNKDIPMGTFLSTDQTTFKGALNALLKGLSEKFPSAAIVFLTPMKNNKSVGFTPSFTANAIGLKQIDYVNAIKETCDYYGIPVLDLYAESGISPFVTAQATAYMPDLLHYNQTGYLRLAKKISSFLESL